MTDHAAGEWQRADHAAKHDGDLPRYILPCDGPNVGPKHTPNTPSPTEAELVFTEIESVENEIEDHFDAIVALRSKGARLLADDKRSGQEVMQWLKQRGATDAAARALCVEIIKERRAQSESAGAS